MRSWRENTDHFARLVPNADLAALNAEIAGIVARQAELRTAIDPILADLEEASAR